MSTHQLRPIEQYFPTEPWLERYGRAIDENDEYAEHSAGWGVDFDGSFVFQIEDVPLEETTVADLPPEIVAAVEDELGALSADRIETLLETAPADVRTDVEARSGPLEERATDAVLETTMAALPERVWPELRAELPDLVDALIEQREENVADDGTVYAYLDLHDGDCRGVDVLTDLENREYGFRLTGDYEAWTTLVRGEGDVINMLMSADFDLDGDVGTILQYTDAAVGLADTAAAVESRFVF